MLWLEREAHSPALERSNIGLPCMPPAAAAQELGIYGRLRKISRCGPVGMFRCGLRQSVLQAVLLLAALLALQLAPPPDRLHLAGAAAGPCARSGGTCTRLR